MAEIPSTSDPIVLMTVGRRVFKPFYSPIEMLQLGVFGGTAFFDKMVWQRAKSFQFSILNNVPSAMFGRDVYDQSINYYATTLESRNRAIGAPPFIKEAHPGGWFEWYCHLYFVAYKNTSVNQWRIHQWVDELKTFSFYIEQGVYTPPDPNPNGYTKYTDPNFLPQWKQRMLEMGWDPTKKPSDYGIS